jgi:hypothetical protein
MWFRMLEFMFSVHNLGLKFEANKTLNPAFPSFSGNDLPLGFTCVGLGDEIQFRKYSQQLAFYLNGKSYGCIALLELFKNYLLPFP